MKCVCLICAVALLLALFPMPNDYYKGLRYLISIGAVVVLTQEIKRDVTLLGISFIGVLLVFNPIVPIYLYKKVLWMPINCAAAVLFLLHGFKEKLKP